MLLADEPRLEEMYIRALQVYSVELDTGLCERLSQVRACVCMRVCVRGVGCVGCVGGCQAGAGGMPQHTPATRAWQCTCRLVGPGMHCHGIVRSNE